MIDSIVARVVGRVEKWAAPRIRRPHSRPSMLRVLSLRRSMACSAWLLAKSSRASSNRGWRSMSNSRSSAASRSLVRQLRLARPIVAPMELPICAARNATSSSKSAAPSDAAPPARIWLPVRAASPAFPGGSRYAPVRTKTATSTSGRA